MEQVGWVHSLRAMGKGPYLIFQPAPHDHVMAGSVLILGKRIPPKGRLASRMFYAQCFFAQHAVSMSGNDADFSVTTCEIVAWSMVSIPMNTTLRFADACVFLDHHPIFQHFGTTKHFTNDQIIPFLGGFIPVPGRRTAEQPQICARCFSNCLTLEGSNWIQLDPTAIRLEGAPKPWRFSSLSSLRNINQLLMVCVVCALVHYAGFKQQP